MESDRKKGPPNQGDVVNNRFELLELLGEGAFGSVWLSFDRQRGQRCVFKFYRKDSHGTLFSQYRRHVEDLKNSYSAEGFPGVNFPTEIGEFGEFAYEVSDYRQNFRSLDQVLSNSGPLNPSDALTILSHLAKVVGPVHDQGIVHADLKPSNVLVSDEEELQVLIIDFGMVQPAHNEDTVLVLSTYHYLHPDLISSTLASHGRTSRPTEVSASAIGPHIDIYAMGVMAFELLTGDTSLPRPLSQVSLSMRLKERNPWLQLSESSKADAVANLLYQLLTVRPQDDALSAPLIGSLAESLASLFPQEVPLTPMPSTIPELARGAGSYVLMEVGAAVHEIRQLGRQLEVQTAAFILQSGRVQSVSGPNEDTRVLGEVSSIFRNAVDRARISWRLGIVMSVASFALVVTMVVCAVTLTVVTGQVWWALIFGGVGVSTVIGTLIWRPYDRLFRATILTQQIEMIHIQMMAGFHGTVDVEDRMRVCREAIAALKALSESVVMEGGRPRFRSPD